MKKIPSLFQRNYESDRLVRDEVVPDAAWVANGEGVATRKFDGTCCLVEGARLWKRHEVRRGAQTPAGFRPATDVDEITGKIMGWLLVGDGPEDRWHREAWERELQAGVALPDGTYELIGPKIQGNPECAPCHVLIRHGLEHLMDAPRTFEALRVYLAARNHAGDGIEGIVWHHPDGRMAKIKTKDFGIKRGAP